MGLIYIVNVSWFLAHVKGDRDFTRFLLTHNFSPLPKTDPTPLRLPHSSETQNPQHRARPSSPTVFNGNSVRFFPRRISPAKTATLTRQHQPQSKRRNDSKRRTIHVVFIASTVQQYALTSPLSSFFFRTSHLLLRK